MADSLRKEFTQMTNPVNSCLALCSASLCAARATACRTYNNTTDTLLICVIRLSALLQKWGHELVKKKVSVSIRAVIERINQKLAAKGHILMATRKMKMTQHKSVSSGWSMSFLQ